MSSAKTNVNSSIINKQEMTSISNSSQKTNYKKKLPIDYWIINKPMTTIWINHGRLIIIEEVMMNEINYWLLNNKQINHNNLNKLWKINYEWSSYN